jgi:hypothetical protein
VNLVDDKWVTNEAETESRANKEIKRADEQRVGRLVILNAKWDEKYELISGVILISLVFFDENLERYAKRYAYLTRTRPVLHTVFWA